jgi:hypothetical protein
LSGRLAARSVIARGARHGSRCLACSDSLTLRYGRAVYGNRQDDDLAEAAE